MMADMVEADTRQTRFIARLVDRDRRRAQRAF